MIPATSQRTALVLLFLLVGLGPPSVFAQGTGDGGPSRDRVLGVARQIMLTARYGALVTLGEDQGPQARIVDPLPPGPDFVVYFATNPRSRKVQEIGRNSRVTLLYFDSQRLAYVTLVGRATEARGAEKLSHHKPEWETFFPKAKPEAYTLYRILPSRLEVVSARDGLTGDPVTWRPEIVEMK